MTNFLKNAILTLIGIAVACKAFHGGYAQSQNHSSTGMVEWVTPPLSPNHPQTPEQEEHGRHFGRPVPEPELLQPQLDKSLPAYRPQPRESISGSFTGGCSDVLPRLVKGWVEAFRKYYPNVQIQVPPPFAGSLGAQELVQSKLDFVSVSRELRPDDIKDFKAKFGYPPMSVPVSGGSYRHYGFLDSVSFIVNKDNPIEALSFAQLDGIFSTTRYRGLGAIKTWGQLGLTGEWADKPIHLYGIKPWNGYEEFIRQRVLSTPGQRGEWRDDIRFDKVVFPVAGRVAADPYGIGYTGVAYIDAPVKMLAVSPDQAVPYYSATYENVARATYPLTRLIYFNTNRAPDRPLNAALQELLRFILSREGQQVVLDQGIFIPLRAGQTIGSRARLISNASQR